MLWNREYFMRRKQLVAEKIYEGSKTIGLVFSPHEGLRLATSILVACLEGKTFDLTIYRKPRKDGKFKITITAV